MPDLADRLRYARELSGKSARQLDAIAGCSPGYLAMIEARARRRVGARVLASYARALGASIEWLLFGEGKPPPARRRRP